MPRTISVDRTRLHTVSHSHHDRIVLVIIVIIFTLIIIFLYYTGEVLQIYFLYLRRLRFQVFLVMHIEEEVV